MPMTNWTILTLVFCQTVRRNEEEFETQRKGSRSGSLANIKQGSERHEIQLYSKSFSFDPTYR